MLIPVVDKKDRIIGYKNRSEISSKDIYRIASLWLVNDKGEFLLAQRALTKKNSPGIWANAVDGTVEKGETYRKNVLKEVKEELGIELSILKKSKKLMITEVNGDRHFFAQWFITYINGRPKFKINREEVEQVKWFTYESFMKEYHKDKHKFHHTLKESVDMFKSHLKT